MPLESDEVAELTDELAASDKSITSNGRSITSHDISDLIALEKYRASRAAQSAVSGSAFNCLGFTKLVPPGAG